MIYFFFYNIYLILILVITQERAEIKRLSNHISKHLKKKKKFHFFFVHFS